MDDNPTKSFLVGMLATTGVTASQGSEALAQFATTPFDLVFMDVMLTDDDGIEVTRQLRAHLGGDGPHRGPERAP